MSTSAQGLRVIVTAGATGIGHAFATTVQEAGASIFVCDADGDALSKLHAEHPQIGVAVTGVALPSQVDEMFEAAKSFLGGLDVLINNAGIAGPTAKVEDIGVAEWDRTIAIDLNDMFYCTRLAVPLLKASGGGSIINLSSIAGRLGYPLRTPYSAAKWAIVGFTKSLAIELGPSNIRVNAIQPGVVGGERVNRVISARAEAAGIDFEASRHQFVSTISLRRMVSAQGIASMALFLATPAGANISGQALSVCGDHGALA